MTLPVSGPLTLTAIKGEFGGNASPKISDYYAGGAFVPSGTAGINGPIPSSGAIAFSKFYGASNFVPHANDFFSGSGVVPVPGGAVQLIVEVWGLPGQGGNGATGGADHQGGGGGSGGYSKTVVALSGDAGKNVTYDATGAPSLASAALTNLTFNMTANAGNAGFNATGTTNGLGNTGGTASGGNTTNATGASGVAGNTAGTLGQGGAANNGYAAAGQGGYTISNTGHNIGLQGPRVRMTWS